MHLGSIAGTSSHPFRLLSGAFLTSVTLHAIAGGFLLGQWQNAAKPLPAPRTLQVVLREITPPAPALPAAPTLLAPQAADPVESADPVEALTTRIPAVEPPVEAPPRESRIEPAERQVDEPQPVQAEKSKPKAQLKIVREKSKKRAVPLRKTAKAQPALRKPIPSPGVPATAIPAATPPVEETVNAPDNKAGDDAMRSETASADNANPDSPASATKTQQQRAAFISAANPTTLPAEAAGPVVPPHFDVAYLENPKPAYPLAARRLKLEGVVVLRVLVKASGMPETVVLGQSSGVAVLDEAARAAVEGWRFVPAHQGELAIDHWVDVPIRFRLVEAGDR